MRENFRSNEYMTPSAMQHLVCGTLTGLKKTGEVDSSAMPVHGLMITCHSQSLFLNRLQLIQLRFLDR